MPRNARSILATVVAGLAVACLHYPADPEGATLRVGPPSGWSRVGTADQSYALGTDPTTVHGGELALRIVGVDTSRLRFAGVGQFIKADTYRGKRVRFSAWIRQSNVVGTESGLWMRIDGPGLTLGFDNFSTRPQLGSSDWHREEIVLDVPGNSIGIAFGALMSARGELLVDDATFEVIPAVGPTTNQLAEPSVGGDSASIAAGYAKAPTAPINLGFESP
ncbi:MAG TPA: hypothetical protein VIP11_13210 [Gemmatimonadaceae bacterium]